MYKTVKAVIFAMFFLLVFTTCKKERAFPSWDTELLAPLLKSTLTLKDLLTDSLLQENPDSSLKLVYHDKFYSLGLDSILKIPDTTLSYAYPPFSFPFYHIDSNEVIMNNTGQSYFNMGSVLLTRAKIKTGYIRVETINDFRQKINVQYTIPSATFLSVPFSVTEQVPAGTASGPAYFTKVYSLEGYDVDFRGVAGDKFNTIVLSAVARVDDSVSIYAGDSVIFRNTYFNMVPSYARGYFGKDTVTIGPEETHFGLFDNVELGSLLLEEAQVSLRIDNYTGIDAKVELNSWYSTNTQNASTVVLSSALIGTPININRAIETGNPADPVIPSTWSAVFNNSNSNVKSMVENLPDVLGYALKIKTNPLGNISGSNDFIYADKTIEASVNIEIPLSLSAAGLVLVDTVDFSLQVGSQIDNVNSGTFTLFANNGFPFDAAIQLYIVNSAGLITDSLFTENKVIASAIVDGNLKVIGKKRSRLPVPFNETKLSLLKSTNRMIVKIKYDTHSSPQLVKLYSHYDIDVRLVGDVNYTVNFGN